MKELILVLLTGSLLIFLVTVFAYNIRDQEKCTAKKGVWVYSKCFKKESLMEVE